MPSLLEELTTGPLATELAPLITAGADGAILAVLNRRDIETLGTIKTNPFVIWAAKTGQRAVIEDTASNPLDPLRSIALSLQDLVRGNLDQGLDFSITDTSAMADTWLAAGKMTQPMYEDLMALATVIISRAEQLGINLSENDIAVARMEIAP